MFDFIYGTAWKEERTKALTVLALDAGFRAIDTANQRRHYHEAMVGEALQEWTQAHAVPREELFIQTKFTFVRGQDHRTPYDPDSPIAEQVRASLQSSLVHLKSDYVDSLLLHGPMLGAGLCAEDWEAWESMESIYQAKAARALGVSNFGLEQLQLLCEKAKVKPLYVQNRCFAARTWDRHIRDFCQQNGIQYQGFSLLTANSRQLSSPRIEALCEQKSCTLPQLVFAFARQVGMLPLTGTSNDEHMRSDLASASIALSEPEINLIENVAFY